MALKPGFKIPSLELLLFEHNSRCQEKWLGIKVTRWRTCQRWSLVFLVKVFATSPKAIRYRVFLFRPSRNCDLPYMNEIWHESSTSQLPCHFGFPVPIRTLNIRNIGQGPLFYFSTFFSHFPSAKKCRISSPSWRCVSNCDWAKLWQKIECLAVLHGVKQAQ